MKIRNLLIFAVFLLSSCTSAATGSATPQVSPTAGLPTPLVSVTRPPDAQAAAETYLKSWQSEDYSGMYNALTRASQDAIPLDQFTARYKDVINNLSAQSWEASVLSSLTNPSLAQVSYRVVYHTSLFKDITRETVMNLALDGGQWKVQWSPEMILPELKDGRRLTLDTQAPSRADIYARAGKSKAIVTQADAVALGIIPGEIGEGQEGDLLQALSDLTGKTPQSIKALYEKAGPNWYVPVGEAPAADVQARYNQLSGLGGLRMNDFTARFYYDGGIAPHATGYVLSISKEELDAYRRKGYLGDEKVGASGLEKWGEDYLAGKRSASLYLVDQQGQIVDMFAKADAEPSQAITMTIDRDLQMAAQQALAGFRGAIVVLERDTGRVLALASSPSFDPNLFEPTNYNSGASLGEIFSSNDRPLINRATQGGYPLGSVFKIITMAAALESGVFTAESSYNCTSDFTELPGQTLYDWTVEKELPPSGQLTLPEGLMRSCNPWFWHIGLELYRQNKPKDVSAMARAFGLGADTGIQQVAEDTGSMPDPANEGDAVQLAIGQGTMLVTPLQVADFVAAVGNGGMLYRPQLVEKIAGPDGKVSFEFKPEVRSKLPVKPENLKIIQDAMRSVIANRRGTAYRVFVGLDVPVYGKTGTAQNPNNNTDPHAWFAGYTDAKREGKPDIAIAILVENSGDGSYIAAPMFRRLVEVYFYGRPGPLYPWEASLYVTKTPVPDETATPTEQPAAIGATETPQPRNTPTPIR